MSRWILCRDRQTLYPMDWMTILVCRFEATSCRTTRTSRWCLHLLRSGKFRQFRGEQSQQSHVLAQLKANGYSRCTNSLGKNSKPWQDESKFTKDVAFFVVHHFDWLRPSSLKLQGKYTHSTLFIFTAFGTCWQMEQDMCMSWRLQMDATWHLICAKGFGIHTVSNLD